MQQAVQSARRIRFASFEVNLDAGEVRKHGLRVKVQDKPFQVLALLLERAGQVVTREELRQHLWPADTFVDFDANLNTTLNKLRHALGDSADNPRFVATIPRRGYCFIFPAEPIEENSKSQRTFTPIKRSLVSAVPTSKAGLTIGKLLPVRWARIVALALLIVLLIVLALLLRRPRASPSARPPARSGPLQGSLTSRHSALGPALRTWPLPSASNSRNASAAQAGARVRLSEAGLPFLPSDGRRRSVQPAS